mgnify:CR=1 FL=1
MLDWEELIKECNNCRKCGLSNTRTNVVIGRGNPKATILLVGEGPGEQEDKQGLPFVGPAGKLLDLLLSALMFKEEDYYIANIVKCRPPNNRVPLDEEAEACLDYLRNQLLLIRPKIIVCLGSTAAKHIIGKDIKITQIRGQWVEKKGYWIMPTFHPAFILRQYGKTLNQVKWAVWHDFNNAIKKLTELCPDILSKISFDKKE